MSLLSIRYIPYSILFLSALILLFFVIIHCLSVSHLVVALTTLFLSLCPLFWLCICASFLCILSHSFIFFSSHSLYLHDHPSYSLLSFLMIRFFLSSFHLFIFYFTRFLKTFSFLLSQLPSTLFFLCSIFPNFYYRLF